MPHARISFLTLNVWALPEPLSRHLAPRMQAIGAELPRLAPDVAAFQEVWVGEARAALVAAGRRAGYEHVWHREATLTGSGLLVLSRFPLREERFHPFTLCGLPQRVQHGDYYGGKGFVQLVVEAPGGAIELLCTHLHADYGNVLYADEYFPHRVAQMVELSAAVAAVERPVVLLGDLNCYEQLPEIRVLLGLSGMRDVAAQLDRREETVIPFTPYQENQNPPGTRKDYAMMRDGTAQRLVPRDSRRVLDAEFEIDGERATFSDHAGLLVELERVDGPGAWPRPDPAAVREAREILHFGRESAGRRRREQRVWAGGCAVALAGTRVRGVSRRNALRLLLRAASGVALLGGGGALALAEVFAPEELRGYDRVGRTLDAFGA